MDIILEMLANVNLEADLEMAAFFGKIVVTSDYFRTLHSVHSEFPSDNTYSS